MQDSTGYFTAEYGKKDNVGAPCQSESRVARRVSWRGWAFVALTLAYIALTLCIVHRTSVLTFDSYVKSLDWRHSLPESWKKWISFYVAAGQRAPSTLLFLPFFIWIAWRKRSPQPLVLLSTALVLLNVSVGVMKVYIGRKGPLRTYNTHAIFDGGNIYPSGHVSNTVVLYGLMAWIAIEHRRWFVAAAVWLSVTVGMGTIYLNTHWFSDVVGGWMAGGLVLLALPWVMPYTERAADAMIARLRARRARRRAPTPMAPERTPAPQRHRPVTGAARSAAYASRSSAADARPAIRIALPRRLQGKVTSVSSAARSQS